nr:MAG TPA: hypothetical protein [Caudoviricetes sp.]
MLDFSHTKARTCAFLFGEDSFLARLSSRGKKHGLQD